MSDRSDGVTIRPDELLSIRNVLTKALASCNVANSLAIQVLCEQDRDGYPGLRNIAVIGDLVRAAETAQDLSDRLLRIFGETDAGFSGPRLRPSGVARLDHFRWLCAVAASELGTYVTPRHNALDANSAKESACGAVISDLFHVAHLSNPIVNWRRGGPEKESLAEPVAQHTIKTLAGENSHKRGLDGSQRYDIHAMILSELAYVYRALSAPSQPSASHRHTGMMSLDDVMAYLAIRSPGGSTEEVEKVASTRLGAVHRA
jgi:hypothetical protein